MKPSITSEGVDAAICNRCGAETILPKGKTAQRRILGLCKECFYEEGMHRLIEGIPGLYGDLPFTYYPFALEEGTGRTDSRV